MRSQLTQLKYAVRPRIFFKYLGELMLVIAALLLLPLIVSLFFGRTGSSIRYAGVIGGLFAMGATLARLKVHAQVQANEGMVVTAAAFLVAPMVLAYPWMAAGINPGDAIFEAVSGVTTTGLTTLRVGDQSFAFLFARAWAQWFGGLGIVVLSLALVVSPGSGQRNLAAAEGGTQDLVPGLKSHARRVVVIYSGLTVVAVLFLVFVGMRPADALLHSLTAVSTGGFTPSDKSLAGFAWPIQAGVILICVSGAVPLGFYNGLLGGRPSPRGAASQPLILCVCGLTVSLFLGLFLTLSGWAFGRVVRNAVFLGFSAQTGSGFSTVSPAELSAAGKLILIPAMLVGGGVGSTTGGFKILRLLILFRVIRLILLKTSLSRHAVVSLRVEHRPLEDKEIHEALLIIVLFLTLVFISWLPFVAAGYGPLDSLFEVVSATGTVGLSAGITNSSLPLLLKAVLCADMLLGRLEIVAWLVMLYPQTWLGRKREET